MPSLATLAAIDCCLPERVVHDAVRHGSSRVKLLKIKKKNSSAHRIIYRPSTELEILQRWLTAKIFEKLEVHDSAMAFRPKRSILDNAKFHAGSNYFVRIDFSNFFPSIKYVDLAFAISKTSDFRNFFTEYEDAHQFIQRICFDAELKLPIGYISSPAISNAVMAEFDSQLQKLVDANAESLGHALVTRYADDIVFSTDKRGACNAFVTLITAMVGSWASPKLNINEKKTAFTSKKGGSAIVTGLRVCSDGHVTITRKHKDKIRLMLSLLEKGLLKAEDLVVLRGHLAYARYVAPAFFSNLCAKHIRVVDDVLNAPEQKSNIPETQ